MCGFEEANTTNVYLHDEKEDYRRFARRDKKFLSILYASTQLVIGEPTRCVATQWSNFLQTLAMCNSQDVIRPHLLDKWFLLEYANEVLVVVMDSDMETMKTLYVILSKQADLSWWKCTIL